MKLNALPALVMTGISLYVGTYYLVMFFRRRKERVNLAFALVCISVAIYDISCAGLYNTDTVAAGMLWQKGNFSGMALIAASFFWFTIEFTRVKWNAFSRIITVVFLATIPFSVFMENELTLTMEKQMPRTIHIGGLGQITYHEVEPGMILNLLMVLIFIGMIYLAFLLIRYYRTSKERGTLPIIVSILLFFLISTSDLLTASGVYPFVYMVEYGFMTLILSMAYALLNRFVSLHEAVEDLNRGLELKVAERTRELSDARDALWGEMQLAKKIQTVLLPSAPKIKGYDISAFMVPADEVGGDYYDIINVGNMDWVVIGDVSGHGVSAGLVMMMAQTAIQTALYDHPEMDPSRLMGTINHSISKNIKQLGEDKYMTITVLAAHRDGGFQFSGLHQDILIYRAATGGLDIVETDGMWIGIMDDITKMVTDRSIRLVTGDTLLLFTDGITEAVSHDREGEMYGDKRLAELFRSLGSQPVESIKKGILDSLAGYQRNDDTTLVVMKRL